MRFDGFSQGYVARNPDAPDAVIDVRYSFLPNTIGFNFSKEVGDLTMGGRSSFWSTINDSLTSPTDTAIDVRQLYATVDGSFGQVLIGKDFGLYARSNIFLDEILLGFGSPGLAPTGVSFGNIRTGYPYPTPSAQITYRSPDVGGLKVAAGIFEPANTTPGAQSEQSAPRFEAEVTYGADLNGVALTGWLNGRSQKSENATTSVDSTGLGYGLRASVAGLSVTASGFTSDGDAPVLIVDGAIAEEDADGYLVQGSYTLGANRFVLSYGETDSEQGDFETENTSVAVFHNVNSNLKLVAEYNMFEQVTKSSGADFAEADTLALTVLH